jgi:hypothetical protein
MAHSGGNDRFCARLKTDISAFSSGLQGHLRSCLTILDSSRQALSKNVRHDLVRPQRPELEAEMSVFNLAQKRSFPPLCDEPKNMCSCIGLVLTASRDGFFNPCNPKSRHCYSHIVPYST